VSGVQSRCCMAPPCPATLLLAAGHRCWRGGVGKVAGTRSLHACSLCAQSLLPESLYACLPFVCAEPAARVRTAGSAAGHRRGQHLAAARRTQGTLLCFRISFALFCAEWAAHLLQKRCGSGAASPSLAVCCTSQHPLAPVRTAAAAVTAAALQGAYAASADARVPLCLTSLLLP